MANEWGIGLVLLLHLYQIRATSTNPSFLPQGFQFDYTASTEPVPIPTTAQCDSLPLSWGRAAFTNGPNPQAPYYIQVYTSTFLFPSVINVGSELGYDWPVPYVPGTQYQICMFDSVGVSGGCQRMMTVVPAANTTSENPPICRNLTYPAGILDVEGSDHTGLLSQYGWVDQCTDISIKPLNGTPPFILTIAPTEHPPWNITSNSMSPINYTVQLVRPVSNLWSWGASFFISLVDAEGQTWAYGPLHSGGQGPTDCLALGDLTSQKGISGSIVAATGVGGLIAGILFGGLGAILLKRRQKGPFYDSLALGGLQNSRSNNTSHQGEDQLYYNEASESSLIHSRRYRSPTSGSPAFEIEPFQLPETPSNHPVQENTDNSYSQLHLDTPTDPLVNSPPRDNSQGSSPSPIIGSLSQSQAVRTASNQVYVVHHDAGRAPVTVYTTEGTEVIELPPLYDGNTNTPQIPPREQHRAGPIPRKPSASNSAHTINR